MRKLNQKNQEVETFHIKAAPTWLLSVWAAVGSGGLTLDWQAGSLERSPSWPPGWGSAGWGRGWSGAPACHTLRTLDGRRINAIWNAVPFPRLCACAGCTWSTIAGQQEVELLPLSSLLLQPRFQHHLNVDDGVLDPLQINFCPKHETVCLKDKNIQLH